MIEYKTNRELLAELDKHIKGHTTAKKALINLANRSTLRYYQRFKHLYMKEDLIEPGRCLLIGESGTGKTATVRALFSKILDIPILYFDASKLRPGDGGSKDQGSVGWMKKQIASYAEELKKVRPYRYNSIEGTIDQMIVCIDEVDKLSYSYESSGNWNNHIQASLLELLDQRMDEYAGVSYVLMGAFTRIDRGQKKVTQKIGFNVSTSEDVLDPIHERLIAGGMLPELVGRLTSIVELDTLTEKDYREILDELLIPKKLEELLHFNYVNKFVPEDMKNEIVKKAIDSKQGVRYMKRKLDEWATDLEFYYEDVTEEDLVVDCLENRYKRQSID